MNSVEEVVFLDSGLMGYADALEIQKKAVSLVSAGTMGEFYFFLEHHPVYTAGIHYREARYDSNIDVVRVERGGGITFHGPGQLVVYPVVNLAKRGFTVKDLIMKMHDSVIDTLLEYGIESEGRLDKHTGVWVGDTKICSTGFYIKGSTTMHGLALNVNTDLNYFMKIDPCGFSPEIMTTMHRETGREISMEDVRVKLWKNIREKMEIGQHLELESAGDVDRERISALLSGTAP